MSHVIVALVLMFSFTQTDLFAHRGRTDKDGCHTDSKTGKYHCHKVENGKVTNYNEEQPIKTAAKKIEKGTKQTTRKMKSFAVKTFGECCRHCGKGKACGDSCISANEMCHKEPGCACDGN